MSSPSRLLSLLLSLACLCALAQAQDAPPPPQPGALDVPAEDRLQIERVKHFGLIRQPDDQYSVMFRPDILHRIDGSSRVQLGNALLDVRVSNAVKFTWLPTSLYVFPVVKTDTFTKTGAASVRYVTPDGKDVPSIPQSVGIGGEMTGSVTRTHDGVQVPTDSDELSVGTYVTSTTVRITLPQRVVVSDPNATTTFTYDRYALYGVATANLNHIFDWGANPLRTENERVGVGVMWSRKQPDIPNGVAFDLERAGNNAATPSQHVFVPLRGFEVSRSISGGDPTWYLSCVLSY